MCAVSSTAEGEHRMYLCLVIGLSLGIGGSAHPRSCGLPDVHALPAFEAGETLHYLKYCDSCSQTLRFLSLTTAAAILLTRSGSAIASISTILPSATVKAMTA